MNNRKKAINMLLMISLIVLAVLQVVILNKYSTIGDKLSAITQEITETENENGRLSQKIASSSALTFISIKAQGLGLTKASFPIPASSPLRIAQSGQSSL